LNLDKPLTGTFSRDRSQEQTYIVHHLPTRGKHIMIESQQIRANNTDVYRIDPSYKYRTCGRHIACARNSTGKLSGKLDCLVIRRSMMFTGRCLTF